MTYFKHVITVIIIFVITISCSNDSSEDLFSVNGNWIISELTYDQNPVQWGECGHLENISFFENNTFEWQLYGVNVQGDCIPINPPASGTWEYLNTTTVELTDDDRVFQVTFDQTMLVMEFIIDISEENPNGILIRFVFLRP